MRSNPITNSLDNASPIARASRVRFMREFLVLGLLAGFSMWWQTEGFRATKSITVDESTYYSAAQETVAHKTITPRLAMIGTAPLPILLTWVPAVATAEFVAPPTDIRADDRAMEARLRVIFRARLIHALLIGVPLVLLVALWLWLLRGFSAALLGTGIMSLSPTIIGHSAVATTDVALAFMSLATLASLSLVSRRLTAGRFLLSAIVCGMAMGAKYSGIFLLPVAGVALFCAVTQPWAKNRASTAGGPRRAVLEVVALWGCYLWIAGAVCWAVHGLAVLPIRSAVNFPPSHGDGWLVSWGHVGLPAPFVGMIFQYLHNESGHAAFLAGETRLTGWWYYFPLALVLKSTPSELLLLGLLPLAAWQFMRTARGLFFRTSAHVANRPPQDEGYGVDQLLWWTALLLYGFLLLNCRVQIGHRYLLPIYPLFVLVATDWLACWWQGSHRRAIATIAVLMTAQLFAAAAIAPHYLAYFSFVAGGPKHGHRWLSDSNIDWGQDLPQLRDEIVRRGYRRALLSYFGTGRLGDHGLDVDLAAIATNLKLSDYDCLAVSVMDLYEVRQTLEDDIFRRLR